MPKVVKGKIKSSSKKDALKKGAAKKPVSGGKEVSKKETSKKGAPEKDSAISPAVVTPDEVLANVRKQTAYGTVEEQPIVEEMQRAYLEYAMSVIVSRALPDVRDGMKPVHRRILYAMWSIGLKASAKFRKSATVVGEVLGKYHPHGDSAVYESMVRMAQDFSMRYPLVRGQGNFGSMDGDNAAAMRYCVTGDTLILSDQGILPIKEISSKSEAKIDLQVLNYRGEIKKASKFFNSGKHKIIKVTTAQGYEISGSYNHPLMTWGRDNFGRPAIAWKMLAEINEQDYVLINRSAGLFSKVNPKLAKFYPFKKKRQSAIGLPKIMNKNLAFLLGALVSEGSYSRGQISFNNSDLAFYNKVKRLILTEFSGVKLYEREIKGNCRELSIYQEQVVEFLHNLGLSFEKSEKKEIPFTILGAKKEVVAAFLQALFEGDGSINYNSDKRHSGNSLELAYHSKSAKLIKQLKIVLLNFGIVTSASYQDKRNACYKLIISGVANILIFQKAVGFWSERKKAILAKVKTLSPDRLSRNDFIPFINDYLRANYKKSFIQRNNFDRYNSLRKNYAGLKKILTPSDLNIIDWLLATKFFFNQVKTLEHKTTQETVYSVKVDSACHSFIANGFVNHNTEAKLAAIAEEMLFDIDRDTVDFIPNYDGSHKEPRLLPSKLPNLLLNGTMGIAVGMSTNIPPHNLRELAGAIDLLITNPEASTEDLMEFVKGPDFPTGGMIYDKKEILAAYATGKGGIVLRGRAEIEEEKGGGFRIIVSEIPYQVNKADLVEKIATLVKDKKLEGIKALRDESDKDGVRIVMELKRDSYPKKILNSLYKHTSLQTTFHLNMLALVDGIQPKVLTLKMILEEYIKHREEIVRRRTLFDLNKAKDRAHILEGLMIALKNIDAVIKTIKASKDKEVAKVNLIKKFKLSERQAIAILEMRLQNLANLEQLKIEQELKEKQKLIKELEAILKSVAKMRAIVRDELKALTDKYGDERRTQVVPHGVKEFSMEDLVPNEETVVMMTRDGYIKRLEPDTFKVQARGGKGVMGLTTKEEDTVEFMFSTQTHNDVLFFTTKGRVFQLKVYEIPAASRVAKGTPVVNFLQLIGGEQVSSILPLDKAVFSKYLFFATAKGLVKKVELSAFANVRRSGLIAIKIKDDDKLIWVKPTSGSDHIQLISAKGQAIRFSETDVRDMGRGAAGVHGIRLHKDDLVIGMGIAKTDKEKKRHYQIITIMAHGFGKRTDFGAYKVQGRGGSGIKTAKVTDKTGDITNAFLVNADNMEGRDLIVVSEKGQVIRTPFKSVSELGRDTQGVRVMRFKEEGDKVAGVTWV